MAQEQLVLRLSADCTVVITLTTRRDRITRQEIEFLIEMLEAQRATFPELVRPVLLDDAKMADIFGTTSGI